MKLVNALLDFSRIEAGRTQASFEPTDLAAFTGHLASSFRSAIDRAGLAFEVACEVVPDPVYVDRDMWEKIVLNLLSNALKFTERGAIGIKLSAVEEGVTLDVWDTGTGIAAEEIPHLFDRFHRITTGWARSHEGSGIGLALVRELAQLHGGSVTVASRLDGGTKFSVSIPSGTAHLPAERIVAARIGNWTVRNAAPFVQEAAQWGRGPEPSAPASSAASSSAGAPARVLVVDENADLRAYMVDLLGQRYTVETAVDGIAALEAARARRPAVVVSDVMMPRLDGVGLLKALRADPELVSVPVVLLSARAGEEATVEGLEAGADDYLAKPFSARELLARVATLLELGRQRDVFERFFSLSADLLCIMELDGRLRRVNHGFTALGYDPAELVGRPFLELVHPDDRAATQADLATLAGGAPVVRLENRCRRADGSTRRVAWTWAPDADGALFAIARDVTDERANQAALVAAKNQADELNRELESFSHAVAHDLRSPLQAIDGFSEALLEDYGDALAAEGRQYVGFVRESAAHMARLIDDLLTLSRVRVSELQREPVDLSQLAREAVTRLRRSHPDREVEVTIEDGLVGAGDPGLLALVLDNLLGNAWKFTQRAASPQIAFGAAKGDGGRVYSVRDNGAGFDMALAPKLFGAFQRLHSASEFTGTGLGLATVQRVILRHGGRVWAGGEVGAGATFSFTLDGLSGPV